MPDAINGKVAQWKPASDKPISTNDRLLIIDLVPWDIDYHGVNGAIDEVAILDWALEEEDVRAIYESGWDATLKE